MLSERNPFLPSRNRISWIPWLFLCLWLPPRQAVAADDLIVEKVIFGAVSKEISGMAIKDGHLYVVADDMEDTALYRVRETGNRFEMISDLDLAQIPGYKEYMDLLQHMSAIPPSARRFDLEGVSICGDAIYLANERARHILRIVKRGSIELLPINFGVFDRLFEGGENAGLEGVAVDCEREMLFAAKERSPRTLFGIRMNDWQIIRTSETTGAIPDSRARAELDWSDLTFSNGYLYAIERISSHIVKIDPSTLDTLDRASYHFAEAGLYATNEPYGMAEGIVVTPNHIILAFDNNGVALSNSAQQRFGVEGNPPAIIYFKRPAGF